jgi:adhesin/invasin
MSRTKRRVLALSILLVMFACLQCAEKEGGISPYPDMPGPQYRIQYVEIMPQRVEPGETATVEARVVDLEDEAVEGFELGFEAEFGTVTAADTTDENGIVRVTYKAPMGWGRDRVVVSADGVVSKEAFVQVGEGALEADPTSILADGVSYSELTLNLVDSSGQPVAGALVAWSTDEGALADVTTVTDSTGFARAVLISKASTVDLTATVEALIQYGDIEYTEVVTVDMIGVTVSLTADPTEIPADGRSSSRIEVWVRTTTGDVPVWGAPVSFSTSLGTIDAYAYTDQSGRAEVSLLSASTPGVAEVVGTFGMLTVTTYVTFGDLTLSLVAESPRMAADGISSQYVTATLLTEENTPVIGVMIDFTTTAGVITASEMTDSRGEARALLTTPAQPAEATITASFNGSITAAVTVTFVGLELELVTPVSRLVADGMQAVTVGALLTTEDGNPVVGADVDFTASHGVIDASVRTDLSGYALATLTSADYPASSVITASYGTIVDDEATVTFEDPVITLTATPVTITADPSNSSQITAYVTFNDGMPVVDGTYVLFTTTEGTITSNTTTASGIARVDLEPAGVTNSQVVVKAYVGNTMASTQVMFVPGEPAVVLVSATPDNLPGDGTATATIVAEVTDEFGNHVQDGTLVNFSVVSGNGIVTPTGLTVDGIATAQFIPTGGSATVTVRAGSGTASVDDVVITITSKSPGSIVADPDTAWISVAGTADPTQVTVLARVYDPNGNPVTDGTDVSFEIELGPGGGEYVDDPANGYGPVTKPTFGGSVSATVSSGTLPGTVVMTVTSGDTLEGYVSTSVKIGIAAGPPDSIFITQGNIVGGENCIYVRAVSAIVRDRWSNPVENGTVVYFTLDRPDIGIINPEAYTGGGSSCDEFSPLPNKGVTNVCLKFTTSSMTKDFTIIARCGELESQLHTAVPLVIPIDMSIDATPGFVDGSDGGDVTIWACLEDACDMPVIGATIAFAVAGPGSLSDYYVPTDEYGCAWTVLSIPDSTDAGTATVTGHVWMTDIEKEVEITINE